MNELFWAKMLLLGTTIQEIAMTCNEPIGTIHTRARMALQKLREVLTVQHLELETMSWAQTS
jgi:DNA-directed RNA polymerase specialized sigma24 family protein